MSTVAFSKPVEDSVSKVNDEVAVGEDIDFQRRWWRFERAVWIVFAFILLLDLAGVFGRGPLAIGHLRTADGAMQIKYDHIARAETPALMELTFAPNAIQNGKLTLFVSESLIKQLGTQRVIPSPESTTIGNGGLTYTFPATTSPAEVQFALQPSTPGIYPFTLRISNSPAIQSRVIVMP